MPVEAECIVCSSTVTWSASMSLGCRSALPQFEVPPQLLQFFGSLYLRTTSTRITCSPPSNLRKVSSHTGRNVHQIGPERAAAVRAPHPGLLGRTSDDQRCCGPSRRSRWRLGRPVGTSVDRCAPGGQTRHPPEDGLGQLRTMNQAKHRPICGATT